MSVHTERRRPATVAVAAAVGLVVLYGATVLTVPGQWLDDQVFGLAQRVGVGPLGEWLPFVGRTALPRVAAVALVVVGAVALLRRWWARVAMAATVVLVSVPASLWLRESLPRPDHGYSYVENTLPSTHVTLVAAAAVAILLMWASRRPEWLPGALGILVGLTCVGNVVGHAHRPSDVVASVLLVVVVAAVVCLTGGALARVDQRRNPLP